MTRQELFDWLVPGCEPDAVSLMCRGDAGVWFAWVYGETDTQRAADAWRRGELEVESFQTKNQKGEPYVARNPVRLGLVAHREGKVSRICIDLDAHEGGADTTGLVGQMDAFFGAEAVKFSSKSGTGVHLFYALAEPMESRAFVAWSQAWGFNGRGQPECFPKSETLSQFWLPNEPNENAGDTYIGGTPESAIVAELPAAPKQPEKRPALPKATGEGSPGLAFSRSTTPWSSILDGFCVRELDGRSYWRRPGKTRGGISATAGFCKSEDGREFLYVFSTNWPPFEGGKCYDKFGAYARLHHSGDFSAAASQLSSDGWGDRQMEPADLLPNIDAIVGGLNRPIPKETISDAMPVGVLENMPGLLRDMIEWNRQTNRYWQPELALSGAIALAATVFGRKVRDRFGTRTNVYLICIAPAGAGKDHARQLNDAAFVQCGCDDWLTPSDLASGAGLAALLADEPTRLAQIDELGDLLASIRASGPKARHLATIETYLKEIYSSSGRTWITGGYADAKKNKTIRFPHLVVYGTGSPDKFWDAITPANIGDGVLPRLMIFNGKYVSMSSNTEFADRCPDKIVATIQAWKRWQPGTGNLVDQHGDPFVVPMDSAAVSRLTEHQVEIAERRRMEDSTKAAVWSRTAEKSYKLALIFACARILDPSEGGLIITREDADLAIRLSNWLTRRMIDQVWAVVGENERERNLKRILGIIVKHGPIALHDLTRRTQRLSRRERNEFLMDLEEVGRITVEVTGKKRTYRSV